MSDNKQSLPVLPLRDPDLVVFPGLFCEIDVGRPFSIHAVNAAKEYFNSRIIVAIQNDCNVASPQASDLYATCAEAEIRRVIPIDDDQSKIRIILVGTRRGNLKEAGMTEDENAYMVGEVEFFDDPEFTLDEATVSKAAELKELVTTFIPSIAIEDGSLLTSKELSLFLDNLAGQLAITGKQKLALLRNRDPILRLDDLMAAVKRIMEKVQDNADREEQQQSQQAEAEPADQAASEEVKRLKRLMDEAGMPEEALRVTKQELRRLTMMPAGSSEFQVTYNYVETLVSLPWNKSTEDIIDIDSAKDILDGDHYGLEKVKERILEFLAIRKLAPERKGSILCFYGPPGVGKTSIGQSIARAMGRKFVRMSLGGINDEAEIRGHRRTYVGAIPGKIIHNIRKLGVNNPVYMLDEVDKICSNMRGDPASALLEVLDPEQNNAFTDNYLGVPFDLSQVLFIATVNEVAPIIPALKDRLEIIEIPGYSPFDKIKIAKRHLIPKQKRENGLAEQNVTISDEAISYIIDQYTGEAGVRTLERNCGTVLRKMAVRIASGKPVPESISQAEIPELLGAPSAFIERAAERPEVGLSAGLAWSRHGGSLLFIESVFNTGKGEIKLTGNLGDVLKESATAAFTWIKANAERLGVDLEKIGRNDIHVHLPAGAVPKDGPSAGIAITASILSLITNRPVRNDVAMTGEVTLRGRVLPVGGVKEKILAAHRAGIREIVFPEQNRHDVDELPGDVKEVMVFTPVSDLGEALEHVLTKLEPVDAPNKVGPGNGGETLVNMSM